MKSGKSAFVDLFGEYFLVHGGMLYDLLGSDTSRENLYWVLPGRNGDRYPILWVHSEYTTIDVPEEMSHLIRLATDTQGLAELADICARERRIFVFDNSSYGKAHYRQILMDWFMQINQVHSDIYRKYHMHGAVLLRELHKLVPSLGVSKMGDEGGLLKEAVSTMFMERRHGKLFFCGDTQRDIKLNKDIRDLMTTRIVRRSPDRALIEDVEELEQIIDHFHKASIMKGAFEPAIKAAYPRIDKLKTTQMYAVKSDGRIFYRKHIPLPNHGYLDSFKEHVEDELKITITIDKKVKASATSMHKKGVDYKLLIRRITTLLETKEEMRACDLMEDVEWSGGLPGFLAALEHLRKGGVLNKKSGRELEIGEAEVWRLAMGTGEVRKAKIKYKRVRPLEELRLWIVQAAYYIATKLGGKPSIHRVMNQLEVMGHKTPMTTVAWNIRRLRADLFLDNQNRPILDRLPPHALQ